MNPVERARALMNPAKQINRMIESAKGSMQSEKDDAGIYVAGRGDSKIILSTLERVRDVLDKEGE